MKENHDIIQWECGGYMWYIIIFFDNIIKLFQYAWFIIVPVITILIFLLIKKKKMNKKNIKKSKKNINYNQIFSFIYYCMFIYY